MSHSPQPLLNFAQAVEAEQVWWYVRCENDCASFLKRAYRVTTSDWVRWNVTEILSSHPLVSSPSTTFLSGSFSDSFQLSLLLL